jgi:Domain of unknown function DUF11
MAAVAAIVLGIAALTARKGHRSGDSVTVTITVRPRGVGTITNRVTVTANADPNLVNNTDTEQTTTCRVTSRPSSIPCR